MLKVLRTLITNDYVKIDWNHFVLTLLFVVKFCNMVIKNTKDEKMNVLPVYNNTFRFTPKSFLS